MEKQSCKAGKCQNADKDSRHNDFKVAFASVDRRFKEQENKQKRGGYEACHDQDQARLRHVFRHDCHCFRDRAHVGAGKRRDAAGQHDPVGDAQDQPEETDQEAHEKAPPEQKCRQHRCINEHCIIQIDLRPLVKITDGLSE